MHSRYCHLTKHIYLRCEFLRFLFHLQNATRSSLLLIDELGRSTGSIDAISIAFAVCEQLALRIRPLAIISTHIFELLKLRIMCMFGYHVCVWNMLHVEYHHNAGFL